MGIPRLVESLAVAGQSAALIQALTDRERRLAEVEAGLREHRAEPAALSLELKRLENEARKRITELQCALERNPDEARGVVTALLGDGHLTATPIQTENGRRFLLQGTAVIGNLLACEPVSNLASPTGFGPVLDDLREASLPVSPRRFRRVTTTPGDQS